MGCSSERYFDVIIRNGLLIDGRNTPGMARDIGIRDGKIKAIGSLTSAKAKLDLDAAGKVVCPGFIDIHTHTDTELLVNGNGESKIHQGVTLEIGGNCGSSPFPLSDSEADEKQSSLQRRYGINPRWTDLEGFFQALESETISLNYATLTGQGDLRSMVVGKNDTPATPQQLKEMQRLLIQSVEQGSFGLSTGLEYAPGSYASTAELSALTSVLSRMGGIYATHMRNEDDTVEEAIREALTIGRDAGVFTQISHLKACNKNNWHKVDFMLEMIDKARANQAVLADRYPYDAWGTGLSAFLPLWARQGETEEVLARLNNPEDLKRIKAYSDGRAQRIGGWDRVMISSCSHEPDKSCEGVTLLAGAEERGMEPFDFARELLLNSKNNVGVVGFAMDEKNLHKVLAADFVMVGSDGSTAAPYGKLGTGKPHPRYYGTFPRVLGKYAREEKILSLSAAIHKMTAMPAQSLGIKDRGILDLDHFADIVILDPATVIDKATFADPHQYPVGIEHVFVNGTHTIKDGEHTGARAGQIVRKLV